MGNGVETIDRYAFSSCDELREITIGKSLKSFVAPMVLECPKLVTLKIDEANETYYSKGNCIIEKATNTVVVGCSSSVIPDDGSITAIAPESFYVCRGLTEIVIPEGVVTIGDSAFYSARDMKKLTLPVSLKSIGNGAFANIEFETVTYMGTAEQWSQVEGSYQIDQSKIVFTGS